MSTIKPFDLREWMRKSFPNLTDTEQSWLFERLLAGLLLAAKQGESIHTTAQLQDALLDWWNLTSPSLPRAGLSIALATAVADIERTKRRARGDALSRSHIADHRARRARELKAICDAARNITEPDGV